MASVTPVLVHIQENIIIIIGCSLGQLSLAWLTAQGTDVIPIPGIHIYIYMYIYIYTYLISLSLEPMANRETSLHQLS
jgi:hypothetical protein